MKGFPKLSVQNDCECVIIVTRVIGEKHSTNVF